MKSILRLLQWMLKAALFFTLFAFALNNQQTVSVHFFFGRSWQAPLVLVVLAVFALGLLTGVLGMLPKWWRGKKQRTADAVATASATPAAGTGVDASTRAPYDTPTANAAVTPLSPPDAVATR